MENILQSRNTNRLVKLGQKLKVVNAKIIDNINVRKDILRIGEAPNAEQTIRLDKHFDALCLLLKKRTGLLYDILSLTIVDPFGDIISEDPEVLRFKALNPNDKLPKTFKHYEVTSAYLLNFSHYDMHDNNQASKV